MLLLLVGCEGATGESREATERATSPPVDRGTATSTLQPTARSASAPDVSGEAPGDAAAVIEIVDGDTLRVMLGGERQTVRLIGVDTPETKDPNERVGCYGPEASAFTQRTIEQAGGQVYLERDVSEADRYGRLLRYVWLPDGGEFRMLNELLVQEGYALVSTYPPDVRYQELFLQHQREARASGAGLWDACRGTGVAQPTSIPVPGSPPLPSGGNCDPAYPDVCIPPPPPELDCGEIDHRRFRVLPPDPHGHDRDGDGVGCET